MGNPWSLSRLEIRTPLAAGGNPFARVELLHRERGRITDLGRGDGPVDSTFRAIRQIIGIEATVRSLKVDYRARAQDDRASVATSLTLRVAGEDYAGQGVSHDLLTSCISAYLDAAASASAKQSPADES